MTLEHSAGARALAALAHYWHLQGLPEDHGKVACIIEALKQRRSHGYADWRELLDDALSDIGCTVDWDGQTVRDIIAWGRSVGFKRS
ncbi:hypothetical protein [Methylobacterium oxalidis]|uniref:Uncharacterized protein n=1 Tax=Methylobacterium oxalidis TaxID=944322 RepID=A0A512J9L0_9HYPH|nr:hypothetical protein [Methylobacterium oxalidis]GEP06642.1 hypothetical protein MOX02_46800 [Methylobacterium oxalidis]GJE35381.1 hypothetical protein LDDCCGHA_5599 [Methylobacterium oxalidis]GLS66256.1 hypothetical protein GCM10007888_46380 [Methylobacterium oxalidis]